MYFSIGKGEGDVEADHVDTGIGALNVAVRGVLGSQRQGKSVARTKSLADGGR